MTNKTVEDHMFEAMGKKAVKNEAKIFITLGDDNEFGLSDSSMFIRRITPDYFDDNVVIDLGVPTKENFRKLIDNMNKLEIHLTAEEDYDFGNQRPGG